MMWKLVALALLAEICLQAQSKFPDRTYTPNGRLWVQMNPEEKLAYVIGVQSAANGLLIDAIITRDKSLEQSIRNRSAQLFPKLGNHELARELDAFYAEAENVPVPIFDSIRWIAAKMQGRPKPELDEMIQFSLQ